MTRSLIGGSAVAVDTWDELFDRIMDVTARIKELKMDEQHAMSPHELQSDGIYENLL
jgi:hypothetical protein